MHLFLRHVDMKCSGAAMQLNFHSCLRRVPYNHAVQARRVLWFPFSIRAHPDTQRHRYKSFAIRIIASAAKSNPQNVPGPQVPRCLAFLLIHTLMLYVSSHLRRFVVHHLLLCTAKARNEAYLQVVPSKEFSASEAVEAQLNALRANDQPWC